MYCWHNHPVRAVNHRGFNKEAPENTISAYRLSKEKGFLFVECDVSFTSDNVPVLLHDDTVNRTSNGRGKVSEMTFEALRRLDFGGWVSEKYAGEKIPTFEEFISFCRNVGLYPYIELKEGFNKERAEMLMRLVRRYGMYGKVTWISFFADSLTYIKNMDEKARLGFLTEKLTEKDVATAKALRTGKNEVFIDTKYTKVNKKTVKMCMDEEIPLEVWTIDTEEEIVATEFDCSIRCSLITRIDFASREIFLSASNTRLFCSLELLLIFSSMVLKSSIALEELKTEALMIFEV